MACTCRVRWEAGRTHPGPFFSGSTLPWGRRVSEYRFELLSLTHTSWVMFSKIMSVHLFLQNYFSALVWFETLISTKLFFCFGLIWNPYFYKIIFLPCLNLRKLKNTRTWNFPHAKHVRTDETFVNKRTIYKSNRKATASLSGGIRLIRFSRVTITPISTGKTKQNKVYLATSLPRSNFASAMLIQVPPNVPECLGKPAPEKNWKIRIRGQWSIYLFVYNRN